jgi:adenylate cyclase
MARLGKEISSAAISNLKQEETRSEFQRSVLLIILFCLILTVALTNFFALRETVIEYYGGITAFVAIICFVVSFLFYEGLVLRYLKGKLRRSSATSAEFKFIHTIVEITFPTVMILYMMAELKTLSFLNSPVTLIYFLFIILSILHLDFKVSLFAGALAAIQYVCLVYYGFNHIDDAVAYATSPQDPHYTKGAVLIFAGGAAAFVASELKTRIRSTLEFQNKRSQLEMVFGQQVSKEVSKAIMEDNGGIKGSEATVMFLDIRNFTTYADRHTPNEVIDYQNRFLGPVIDIINQHQGVVFQILGDGVMACFGAPDENVLHADMAFQASLEILKQVTDASEKKLIPATLVGIGLHSGRVVAGNIGNENRKQFSISGSPVIIASRIEQLNKKYGSQLLISEQVYNKIQIGKIAIQYLGEELLRGIATPVKVYRVA